MGLSEGLTLSGDTKPMNLGHIQVSVASAIFSCPLTAAEQGLLWSISPPPPLQAPPRGIGGARDSSLACVAVAANNSPEVPIASTQEPQDPLVLGPPTVLSSPAQPFATSHSGCPKEDAGLAGSLLSAHPVTRDSCFPVRARALHGKVMPFSAGLIWGDFFLTLSVARLLTHSGSTASVFHSVSLQLIPG